MVFLSFEDPHGPNVHHNSEDMGGAGQPDVVQRLVDHFGLIQNQVQRNVSSLAMIVLLGHVC